MADNDNRYKLWQTISKEYDLPDYNQFSKDMEDETKRKSLHDAVSAEYDLPDFDQFSKDMGYETQTTQQGNQNAQNAKKPQQTEQSSHVEEGRGLPSDNGYSKQKTAFDKAASQTWNNLTHQGRVKWTIEGHPEVKMVAVTDDLVKKFPQLEQSRGYQVPFNMSTGTPIMQNIDDKGNIITPDEASEQYTKILTNQNFDYVPKQETAAVQIGSVVNTALSTKGGWLDRVARKYMAQYGDDWEHQKYESDGKEVSLSDVFGKVKQNIYDYYNSVFKGIRTYLMFNSDEEKQAYVDNLYKTGQLKEEDIPKANVLHYVQNVDKEEQIEAVRQRKLKLQVQREMVMDKLNQIPQPDHAENMAEFYARRANDGSELYASDLRKIDKQIAQYNAVIDELEGRNNLKNEWGHAVQTSGITGIGAWDFGVTDLKDAMIMYPLAKKMQNGENITQDDFMSLKLLAQANEADAVENAVMPSSYNMFKGSLQSVPFTVQFLAGGEFAKGATTVIDKAATKMVKDAILKAGGKKALRAAEKVAEKAADSKIIKFCGMLGKDFRQAFVMENTTGAATTGAEILNRHIGTVTESDDGFKMEGESLPTAIIKGEISQNIESQTEFLGEHFPSSLKFIRGMAHTKVGSAMGLRNLAAWLTKVSRTEFATTLKSYATKAGINGVFGEYLEEVAGTAENALLVGDQKFSDLLDVKQQEEVAGSVVLSCLGMGIFGTAIYTGQRGLNMPAYYRLQHLQNKWDNAGLDLFSGEEWAKLKDRIDNTPNEGMKSVMADILKADNMTEEQARAAFNYARCSLTLRGMNLGAMKAAQLGLTDDRHIEQDNAYVEGRQAKDEDKHDIQIEFEDRSHELAEKLGISEQQLDNMSDEELESLTGKDDQLDNLIYDYQTSHAKYQGVVDNADDEIDKAAQEAARQTDMATDKSRGTVRNATIKATKGEGDYGVYIVSGNVATNEDGSINVSESDDMILYYDPKSGKIEHCDAMRLVALGEEVNAEETRNQAIAYAKEKAIRKQAGIIDGTVGEGTSFTITDAEGNEHTYEVLADNGDGSAMITMDGNVQEAPVSLQDLQNLKDAEEAKRLEAAKMQRQQYEEEREKQNTPVEDNLDYADIINTNGNVEIAEVVDEEGNALFPAAEEVFFVQNQGSRAKVMVLDNEGNLQPKLVKKSAVRTLGTMSVDEYRQERQKTLKKAENASEPSLVDETEPSNNVVPTGNIKTDNTTTDETQPGNEAEVTTSDETQKISNEEENTPKITLEDGTEVPMLEDGNPDFSQLTAGQVAELYDSQFGEDAGQIITNNVNRSKKALDKANAMTVSGGSFVEQKASKEAKDKAIAEAKEKYDSAKAIEDAYNERMLAKEEDTPEGRMNLIEKARRKFNRIKGSVKDNAQAIAQLYDETVGALLHRLYDSTGIDVFDDTANTVDEYVASSIAPYSLNYEGTETSKGVKQETGLSRSDFAKTGLLAKEGKGKTIGQLANDLWRDRPANFENITDQDVRNAIIDLITSGQTAFGLKNHIQNLRIAEAENILEQQKRQADELAYAEKQKEEESQSTEMVDNNAEESSNTEATLADAQEEDKLADMPFEAPSPDEDVPFSAKDKAKDPLEVWNNMTDEEKAAYIENNRVKDTRLVDDVIGKKLRNAIEKIAGMMGATIQWQRTDMIRNGWFNPNTKTIYLALDSSILEGVQFVFGHEMTHDIKTKSPAMYDELKGLVKEKYGEELFEAMTNDNEKRYADVGKTDDDRSYYEEETVADAIGDMINDLNLTRSIALKMSHPLLAKMHDVLLKIKNAFTGTPYSDNVNGIIRTIEMAYVKTANREAVNTATQEGEGGQRLSLREKPAPKKTQKVYKLMRLGEDGKLYPLFIGSGAEVELGKWYDAESPKLQDLTSLSSNDYVGTRTATINGVDVKEKYNYGAYIVNNETGEAMSLADFKAKYSKEFAKMGKNPNKKAVNWATDNGYRWIKIEEKKQGQSRYGGEARSYYNYGINGSGGVTTFAMRPGWHAGSLPTMRQIGKGSGRNLRDDTFVWVEGEIPADIDYNEEAQKNADKDIPDHIPTDGYYLKATNANKEASQADRVGWYVAGAFKANRIMSDKEARNIIDEWNEAHPDEEKVEYDWKRESGKDFNAETMRLDGAPKFSIRLQDAINETDTEPTEAQKKSGNYKKGHVKFGGYDYTIENPKGSYRSGVDENGKEWKQKMNDTYGYIRGKFGKDGDHLDMFINDKADLDSWNGDVYVVDQVNPDGTFDEHKVMYGYDSLEEAKEAYLSNYEKGWTGLGNITPVSKAGFDKWLDKSNRKLKPFADYADITSKTNMDTAPSSFEEFLEHPAVRYSIRNEKERAAAEDAYNFAQENRPDRYSRYAIVNMEKPGAVPQYLEKKTVADNWRRYYNKLKWGNYKLFDLDKPFEDNVKNLVGKFPETFRKKNDTTLSKINELTADYNKRKEEYDAMSNSIQELLNGLMKQGRSLAEAESVIRDWGLYKEMDSKYQNLMGIRKQLNELRSGKVADRVMKDLLDGVDPREIGEAKDGGAQFSETINSGDNIRFSLKEEKEKIVADAKANGTYMTAPNGEKTKLNAEQWVTVRTTNFKNWFGDWENDPENASKVVDENGEPMVVWHGRSAEFNTFEKKEGVRFIMGLEDKVKAEGFFFSPNKGLAEEFASNSSRHRGGKANVIPCFLNIRKPMDLTREDYDRIYEDVTGWDYIVGMDTQDNLWGIMDEEGMADKIKEKGYDGAIFVEELDDSYKPTKISYCALDANQIKSADNNNGDFSTENDDIRYSLRVDRYRDELNQWKKDNNLPKDAERPQLPVREPNESAADFLKRVKEYRKQAALWATAPTYEDHLLVSDTAQGQFNLEMQRKAVLTRIVIQDSMLAIRKAQEAIMKEKGVDKLNPAEDAYTAENRSHGKAKNEFEEYNDEFLQPLRKAYNELMQRLGKSYDNVKVYMIAKHGLERNAYIAFKYALDEDYETNEERINSYNNYKADMDRLNNDADFEAGRIDFAAWKQRDGFIRTKYAPSYFKFRFDENGMTKDYSGLSALFDADDYEGAAADLVKEVEDANSYYTDELWYATNDATKKILRDSYNAGMMTEANFNFVSGMYRNYIPLRGWGDTNADQVWNYVGGGKGAFNQVVKEAKGRKSLADDPIAYIENMAESAILMNNRNWVKQHLLLLAQNHRTSLLNVSKAWYIKTKDAQGNEEWIPASPQITEGMTGRQVEAALEAFEQKMEQMKQNGEATQEREHLEISYPQTNGEEREHEVRVMKGGEEYVIYVNGDPQLAQAVNNTRARKVRKGIEESRPQRILARTGRYMAAAYTSMSPLFIPSNYMRDLTMTLASTAIREDARYNYLLRRNMLRHWNTFPMVLSYQNGTLREKVRNGSASRVEQMFYDFMMNGGETGFVTSVDVEDLKKKFKNDLKDLNRMAANPKKVGHIIMNSIETLNRAIEDSNRFMVYMTSIEYGRSIEEAVNNAKDVTLNFNRKGTGEHGWQAVRDMYLFINPAVQSLQTLGALAKHHPFKFTAVTTGWLATGLLVPMLNNLLMSFFGGDDDKDKYWQFTKWDRRNNFIMWIPFTKEFVKIPLAQEFRGFYGVGDMIASKLWGGEKAEESWSDYAWDLAGQIVDMLPLDPTGYDGNIGLAITPNAARPIGELALNVDFTGKPIFKNSEYNKYDPNFTKAYVGTPDWLVRISKMVNSIDNQYPDVEQNAIDRFGDPKFNPNNPAVIDHLLSSYLGGSYTMGSQIIGVATKALNGDDIKMADIPLASKFVSNPDDRPVSKKQGEEFWDMKERHDRVANTLSKLKKKAKIDGDYSTLDIFFGSDEYRQYKEDDKKVKKYEEDRKKEKAQETGEAYRPHKTTADDVYKSHTTPKDDFEDMKMKQLYEKLNSYKIRYEAIDGISSEKGDAYYKANKAAIDAIEEIAYDKSQIASIKKGFLSDGQNTYDADGMKDIRELRKRILDVLEKANKMMNKRK